MKAKKHYEKYWSGKDASEEFEKYERNWILSDLFKNKERVLDVGCGDGAVAEYLQKKLHLEVVGVDISSKAVKKARQRGVRAKLVDAEKALPFNSGAFDAVFWGDNIEHLFDPEATLSEIKRVLKKRGRLIISCPNMGYVRYRLFYLLNGGLADTEWTGNPPWAWSHIRFFNKKILYELLKKYRFEISKLVGVNRRFPDNFLSKFWPDLFGMILVIEARKA